MKYIAPDYYGHFSCWQGKCRHSCCAGWEIDIDPDTLAYYRGVKGEVGKRLAESIAEEDGISFFRMTEEGRCPFLNKDGLCDLILALGDGCLSQICSDHPRFRNFLTDRDEIGLGMCCEAAGHLLLSWPDKVGLYVEEDDGGEEALTEEEEEMLALREALTAIAQDRTRNVTARVQKILSETTLPVADMSLGHWAEFLMGLERLDESWGEVLAPLTEDAPRELPADPTIELAMEQFLVYLLYRHLPGALNDGDMGGRIAFVALMWKLVRALCAVHLQKQGRLELSDMVEICRMYSSEIEYSDGNIPAILAELHRLYPEI